MHTLSYGLAFFGIVFAASCPPKTPPVNVPANDPGTRPDVVLDVHFPQAGILTVTPSGNVPDVPPQLNGNDEISLVATCTDNDSGCRNIEIFADATTFNANNTVGTAPTSSPAVASNPDATARPGGTASAKRTANVKLTVPPLRGAFAGLQLDVSARATNAHGDTWNTKKVSLFWSQQSPLTLPPCVRFSPIGSPAPAVLDSRQVTIGIQNAKAANPARTTFAIGAVDRPSPDDRHAWRLDVEEDPTLPPTSAKFQLTDTTGATVTLLTVDGRSCNTAGTLLTASPNSTSAEVTVTTANTTTVVLSGPNHGLFAAGSHDDAVFNEATFWRAFGGRKTTIVWMR